MDLKEGLISPGTAGMKLFTALKEAGEQGMSTPEIRRVTEKDRAKAQAMISFIRSRGYKVDIEEGIYKLRGMGRSHAIKLGKKIMLSDRTKKAPPPSPPKVEKKQPSEFYRVIMMVETKEAKESVRKLFEVVKEHGLKNIEMVEFANPDILEIRQRIVL